MADYTLKIAIDADDRASGKIRNLRGVLKDAADGMSSLGKTVLAGVSSAAVAGFGALTAAVGMSVKSAMEAEVVNARLAAVLLSTGGRAGWTAEQAESLSLALQNVTGVSDEVITSVQAMLLQFPNLSAKIMPAATEAALDLSRALGIDASSAARLLGRALAEPAEGFGMLRRAGVALTASQEETVKKLVESGNIAEAQKIVMEALSQAVGGTAQAYGKTLSGQLDIARESIGNVFEALGSQLLPVMSRLLHDYVMPLIPQLIVLAQALGERLAQAIPAVVESFKFAVAWLQANKGVIIATVSALGAAVVTFIYTTAIPAITTFIAAAAPVIVVIAAIAAAAYVLHEAWTNNWGGMRDFLTSVWASFQSILQAARAWLVENIPTALTTLRDIWESIWTVIKEIVNAVWPIIMSIYEAFRAAFEGDWYQFGVKLREAWDAALKGIVKLFSIAAEKLIRAVLELIQAIAGFFREVDWGAVGRGIVEGIASGIRNAAGWLADAARAAARAALEAAKGFLGIKSPSRVFEREVGENMMRGWVRAIDHFVPELQLAVRGAGQTALRTAQAESKTVIIYGGVTIAGAQNRDDILRQLWQLGYT